MKNNVILFRNQTTKKDDFSDFGKIKNLTPYEFIEALNHAITALENGDEIKLTLEEWDADKKYFNVVSRLDLLINCQKSTIATGII